LSNAQIAREQECRMLDRILNILQEDVNYVDRTLERIWIATPLGDRVARHNKHCTTKLDCS